MKFCQDSIESHKDELGGGLIFCLLFHPEPWGNDQIWRAYFSNGWFNHQLEFFFTQKERNQKIQQLQNLCQGNLRVPPLKPPPQEIRPYWGTINHWFPLIRPYLGLISWGGWHRGGTLRFPWLWGNFSGLAPQNFVIFLGATHQVWMCWLPTQQFLIALP